MVVKELKFVLEIKGVLRNYVVEVLLIIRDCGGIKIFGKRIKLLLFIIDVVFIRNSNVDVIIVVYLFIF